MSLDHSTSFEMRAGEKKLDFIGATQLDSPRIMKGLEFLILGP